MRRLFFVSLFLTSGLLFAVTRNIVPRADNEGQVGTATKKWHSVIATSGTVAEISATQIKWSDGTIQVSSPTGGGGASVDLSTINIRLDNLDGSTQTITTRLDSLDFSTRTILEGGATVYLDVNTNYQEKDGYIKISTFSVCKRFNVCTSTFVVNKGRVSLGSFSADNDILYSSGGVLSTYSSGGITYAVHTFTSSSTFTPYTTPLNVKVLIVGGGGAGGGGLFNGAGGGGGGVVYKSTYAVTGTMDVHIGVGGTGNTNTQGENGEDSFFDVVIASGGGGGGCNATWGINGGSGGGGSPIDGIGGLGSVGQGYNGGNSYNTDDYGAGGGGGAGGVGGDGTNWVGGVGGIGYLSSITGTQSYYAGGGGGSVIFVDVYDVGGAGGLGGGGDGSTGDGFDGTNGLGGGGGGAERLGTNKGGNGGSGVVIISYPLGGNPFILDVSGNVNATKYYGDITGAIGSTNNEFGEMNIVNQDNADINVKTNNQTRLTINNDGNVGIGTTNPSHKFEVYDGTATVTNGNFYNQTVGFGYILKSPDLNCWRIDVANDGTLSASSISCP